MRSKRKIQFVIILSLITLLCIITGETAQAKVATTPTITSLKAVSNSGVSVNWKSVKGASGYEIYRTSSLDGSSYNKIGFTKNTGYTDKTAFPNITYHYSLKAVFGNSTSKAAKPKSITTPYKTYKSSDKAVFSNSLLESWVRKKLNKTNHQVITIKDLDKFTRIGFVAGTEVTNFDYYYNSDAGGVYNPSDDSTKRGFDFYDLSDFMQFRNLDTLYIMGEQVTDISPLANIKNLQNINLTSNHVSDINVLKNISGLRKLVLDTNPIHNLNVIPFLNSLDQLNINRTPITTIKPLVNSSVKDLSMDGTAISDLSGIKHMKLETLNLVGSEYKSYSFLKDNHTISTLSLSDLNDEKAKVLSGTKIKWLYLFSMDDGSVTKLSIPTLKGLYLYNCGLNDLSFASKCTNLQDIEANNAAVSNISALSGLTKLNRVCLSQTNTLNVTSLSKLKQLKEVTLPSNSKTSYNSFKNTVNWKPAFTEGTFNGALYKYASFPVSENAAPRPSSVTTAQPVYENISKVGSYNQKIITNTLLNKDSSLPEASNQALPYWKGTYIDCYKFSVNKQFDPGIMSETMFQFLSDNGFNYIRILYSFSYLHNPKDTNQINLSELERIDEIISWGIKYNVHVQIAMTGLPGKWNAGADNEGINTAGGTNYINSSAEQKLLANYWSMLAKRYSGIPNKFLSFDLYAEPNIWNSDASVNIVKSLANSVWSAEGNKTAASKRVLIIENWMSEGDERSEALADIGCAFSAGFLAPHRFATGTALEGFYEDNPYLTPTDTWPYFFEHRIGNGDDKAVTITRPITFPKGTEIRIYLHKDNNGPVDFALLADGKTILDEKAATYYEKAKDNYYSVTLKESAKNIKFMNTMNEGKEISLYQITVQIPGKDTVHLVPSSFANLPTDYHNLILTIGSDLSISSNIKIDSDWYYNTQILPYVQFAKAHNIGYIVHESGAGFAGDSIYKNYMEMQLDAFQANQVAWSSECINDFFLYPQHAATWKEYKNTGWFYDKDLIDIMKKYTD